MKRTISFFLLVSLIISTLSGTVIVYASGSQNEPAENTIGTNYYIDAVTGSDDRQTLRGNRLQKQQTLHFSQVTRFC